jgi:hypothetical protein
MNKPLVLGAAALACAAAFGIAQNRQLFGGAPDRAGSLMLTVQIDASGVRVMQATRKPDVEFRAPKAWQQMPLRWVMRDAQRAIVAEGGFDPAELCLDPTHAGLPAHVRGDLIVPHVAHTNVKVPELGAAFASIEFTVAKDGVQQPFGVVQRAAITTR